MEKKNFFFQFWDSILQIVFNWYLRLWTDRCMGMIGMIWMSMSGVAGRCRVSRFPYAWVGCMKMATCRRMGRSMGVGIKTSMGNPSNVGLKVPVHVAQGSCGVFTELHLLHMYILYTQPSGLVISQHLCTLHTHQHQNIERGFGALSNISCHIEWGLLHREYHDCLFTAGTRHFKLRSLFGWPKTNCHVRLFYFKIQSLT